MKRIPFLFLPLLWASCGNHAPKADAYGNFEAEEYIVSAEANGQILQFDVDEGLVLRAGQVVGAVDSVQLILQREQLRASIRAVAAKSPAIREQLAVYEKQLDASRRQLASLEREKQRVQSLLKQDAATPKQLDELNDQIDLIHKQMAVTTEQRSATDASLSTQKSGLLAEIMPLQKQIERLDDQIAKCRLVNPMDGTVLVQYAEAGEVTTYGKPLYKLADMDTLVFRAYLAGDQLSRIVVGQSVTVRIDGPDGGYVDFPGRVTWIASEAEFTPKVIQTKNERVHLVYAIKVLVGNDGRLKIGMPGEMIISG
ncbi:MAG: HlyD family efflux transporter periplasmic adaptor subunit [Saprospiraceae bacterium]|nr:HlyD family efflux transporter periplasmic adaptor subunit [Saprospiraceae bacterium]